MKKRHPISMNLGSHYAKTFSIHGEKPEGVDWGPKLLDHQLRLDRMIAIAETGIHNGYPQSLLDVGCGYGSLLDRMNDRKIGWDYTGIDICEEMINSAKARHPNKTWMTGDVLDLPNRVQYDYVVCNGILTQKLNASQKEMDSFVKLLVKHLYSICRIGVAFNVMTTHVNYMASNLYYRNPAELLCWCMTEVTTSIKLDHSYPLYEYTVYLYKKIHTEDI